MTFNKLGDLVETKYIIQKSFLWFWWINVKFIKITCIDIDFSTAESHGYVKEFSSFDKAEQALLRYNEINGRTYQRYEGHKIVIGIDNYGSLQYCYKGKKSIYHEGDGDLYYSFNSLSELQRHVKTNIKEDRELIQREYNLT